MASRFRLFKRTLWTIASIGIVVAAPIELVAQAPDEDWRTITTAHFRVTFPERLEPLARRAADRAEWAYAALAGALIEPPNGAIDVVVTDHTDRSNGFATVFPSNRITVFARPPVDQLSLGHFDDWMELVLLHELAHIVHLDDVRNPIGKVARSIFGRVSAEWPFFPSLGTPLWISEGLATWYESSLTQSGRVRGTYQEMQLRTAVLEGRFEGIGEASGDSPLWPGGDRPYSYGARFFEYLLDKHGEERMSAFVDAISGQWIPYRMNAAGREAFGASLSDEWDSWEGALRSEYADLDERLARHGDITVSERLTTDARWGLHPRVSPDGRTLVYTRSDGRSDIQLRIDDPAGGSARKLTRTNGLSTFDWTPDGRLVVSQMELHGPYRSYGDLYLGDTEGALERLTQQERLSNPSVSPDGRFAVAVQQGDGTNGLVRVDLLSGAVTSLVAPDPAVHWAFPSVSPDGRWIAATRWEPDAYTDIVLLDAASGVVRQRITRDRAMDLAPSWGPDGDWLVWGSDRTGIPNIFGARIDPGSGAASAAVMLTNVRTGAAFPSIDPSGEWLYYSGYHVDGWEVERTRFTGSASAPAPAAAARFQAGPPPTRGVATEPMEGYRPGLSLAPTYWEISHQEPMAFPATTTSDGDFLRRREALGHGVGIQTTGQDLVGRHSYSVFGRVFTEIPKFEAGIGYANLSLGNPIISMSASQRFTAAGQLLGGTAPNTDTLFIFQRERRLETALTVRAPRWRHDLWFTASAAWILEHNELRDRRMEETTAYRLSRPDARAGELGLSANFVTARSHSFQMGMTRGINLFAFGRVQRELSLPDTLRGVSGVDRSFGEVTGRARAAIPLWSTGRVTHVLALQAAGGVAAGAGAGAGHFSIGGASGRPEDLTGVELFGGSFILFPVRGYGRSSRFGQYAWSATAEYRFPLLIANRGLGAWPVHFDRVIGSLFLDAGNAWGPDVSPSGFVNAMRTPLVSIGAEVTTEVLARFDIALRLRTGIALTLVSGTKALGYVRVGLPF